MNHSRRIIMEQITKETTIHLGKKDYLIGDVVKSLMTLPGDSARAYFQKLALNVPKTLRMDVIKNVLAEQVRQTRAERNTLADELNYRLKWFPEYSDTQCVNLLDYYQSKTLDNAYLESFWLAMVQYMMSKGVSDEHLEDLFSLGEKQAKKAKSTPVEAKPFNDLMDEVFYDEPNYLDGLAPDKIRPVLFKSSTTVEIREIGKKYGVNVPRRLKKQQLLEVIFDELKERKLFTEALKEELSKKSVIAIQRYATDHDIKVSTELKKEEIIEYILEHATQTKETYFKAETKDYDFEVEETQQEASQTKETPKEEKKAPKEQTKKQEKKAPKEAPQAQSQPESTEKTSSETNDAKPEPQKETKPTQSTNQPLVINAASFGSSKQTFENNYLDLDGTKQLIPKKQRRHKLPAEIRFVLNFFLVLLIIIARTVAFVLIVAFLIASIVFIYGSVVHFADIPSLDSINELINSVDVLGKGILEHIAAFYSSFGLK